MNKGGRRSRAPTSIYKATVVVSVCPSVRLAGQGQGRGRAGWSNIFSYAENNRFLAAIRIWEFRISEWPKVTGRGRAGAGQGGQTFSVTLRITDFWPRSEFGNFGFHSGQRSRAPTSHYY